MNESYTNYSNIGKFISNVNGDWRKSIYVTCTVCRHDRENCTGDILISFDSEGRPAVIKTEDANEIFSTIIDKSECLVEISSAKVGELFENLIIKHTEKECGCPFIQLTQKANFCK